MQFLNRVHLSVRPNNQITLTFGNYSEANREPVYKDYRTFENGLGKHELYRRDTAIARLKEKRKPKFNWCGRPIVKVEKRRRPLPLVIIQKSQRVGKCHLNRPKNFTNAAGQKLRECGAAIDQICGDKSKTVAITLTLPADHEAAFFAIAAYSGYAINRLFQPVRRGYGDEVLWFFVWEYQGRGALHLHCALYHPDSGKALEIGRSFRAQWHKILCDIGKRADTDMFLGRGGRDNSDIDKMHFYCEPMRKSLGAYFSKYAGKEQSKQDKYCQRYPVSRFWGCCYALKSLIKSLSLERTWLDAPEGELKEIVERILDKMAQKHCNLQSNYEFDINKTYQSGYKLHIAKGERYTFYCHPEQFQAILRQLSEEYGIF